ncbi:hypothetical protein BDY21DRAFT_342191 [Lineolata rhizophorae]|uniref:Uncharacterized protein n=1 Tax=Lineolata rhizophorae TaxID=578093 RepID=A0A6A6P3K2_9PEZI|nr:hypothetical protein BDY21DRAFT_342191 [Lineolata rhizophorae]
MTVQHPTAAAADLSHGAFEGPESNGVSERSGEWGQSREDHWKRPVRDAATKEGASRSATAQRLFSRLQQLPQLAAARSNAATMLDRVWRQPTRVLPFRPLFSNSPCDHGEERQRARRKQRCGGLRRARPDGIAGNFCPRAHGLPEVLGSCLSQ